MSNQGRFYPRFDAVVLLHAPAEVLLRRVATRATNDYGKSCEERDLILHHLAEVDPLLRATCTHEVDATQPLDVVVARLVAIGEAADKDPGVAEAAPFDVRPALDEDRVPMAVVFAAVAEEHDGIATEPPVDVDARAASWTLEGAFVAVVDREVVGSVDVDVNRFGFGEIGMAVARDWRGRGVGAALLAAAIEWSRGQGLHKLSLSVFPHNAAGIALYRKFGFVEEGRRVKQIRRQSGELWDVVDMGLLL